MMKDFYYILGTNSNATGVELNAAYRKLAKKLQPDAQDEDGFIDHHFREITEAYQTLSDPVARRRYDTAIKKAHQNRFYFFKIRYINVAVMLALIIFTGLFGYYVSISLSGLHKAKNIVKPPAKIAGTTLKHYKKKRHGRSANIITAKKPFINADTASRYTVVAAVTPRIITLPIVEKPPVPPKKESTTAAAVTTEIRANATGVVYLHQASNYQSAVLATIPNSAKVEVLETSPGFYKITYQGQIGYVPKWAVADQ